MRRIHQCRASLSPPYTEDGRVDKSEIYFPCSVSFSYLCSLTYEVKALWSFRSFPVSAAHDLFVGQLGTGLCARLEVNADECSRSLPSRRSRSTAQLLSPVLKRITNYLKPNNNSCNAYVFQWFLFKKYKLERFLNSQPLTHIICTHMFSQVKAFGWHPVINCSPFDLCHSPSLDFYEL